MRVVTNPRINERPASVSEAWGLVEEWLECANVWIPAPAGNHRTILARLLRQPGIRSSMVPDVHLAALAMEHGLILCSADADFARFPGLKWTNPLEGSWTA
jgi:predicted nucleic acid-binding protein